MGVSFATSIATGGLITLLDEVSSSVTYVGKAAPRSLPGSPVWQIQRITTSGTLLAVEYADGDDRFDNVWDNRASLGYS